MTAYKNTKYKATLQLQQKYHENHQEIELLTFQSNESNIHYMYTI